jgi:hypothetical protein
LNPGGCLPTKGRQLGNLNPGGCLPTKGRQLGNLGHVVMLSAVLFLRKTGNLKNGLENPCCHVVGCAFLKKDWQLEKMGWQIHVAMLSTGLCIKIA